MVNDGPRGNDRRETAQAGQTRPIQKKHRLSRGARNAIRWIFLAAVWLFLAMLGGYSVTHYPYSAVTAVYIIAAAAAGTWAIDWMLKRRKNSN